MNNCLSRVRGWWVRGQRRSWSLWKSRALQMTDRGSAWSQRGGGSSRLMWPREMQQHRSESDTPVIIHFSMHRPPHTHTHTSLLPLPHPLLFILPCCTGVFYIDVRHVGWTHPSSDGAQWFVDRRWTVAVSDWCGINGGSAANRAVEVLLIAFFFCVTPLRSGG